MQADENGRELRAMVAEYEWLLQTETGRAFERLAQVLDECGARVAAPYSAAQPDKLLVASANGADAVRCHVTLLGDNIVHADVAVRYQKAPGHFFRSVAQPDVQWRLQQIQDVANYVSEAAALLQRARTERRAAGRSVLHAVDALIGLLHRARIALLNPRKRSLIELQESAPLKCFNPPLPPDLLLSFYVSASKLVCAAYLLQTSGASKQIFHIYQGECVVPWLADMLTRLGGALRIVQQLRDKLRLFVENEELRDSLDSTPSCHQTLSVTE